MKRLLVLLLLPVISHSFVFENNITARIGGAFNGGFIIPNDITATEEYNSEFETLGGGYSVEVGYLWLQRGFLTQAVDARLGFGQNFGSADKAYGASITHYPYVFNVRTMHAYVGATYTVGTMIGPGTFMVDTLGLNFGWMGAKVNYSYADSGATTETKMNYGNSFLLSVNLPLGMQYIFNNGISLGFRHRVDFAFGAEYKSKSDGSYESGSHFGTGSQQNLYIAYNLTISAGFTFGIQNSPPPRGEVIVF